MSNTNRAFGSKNNVPQKALTALATCFGLVNGGTRFIWGMLVDKFGFKLLMIGILCFEIVVSGTIYFSVKYTALYLIENFIVAIALSGTFTMITPEFNKAFGVRLGAKIYGITGFLIGVSSFLGPVLTKLVVKHNRDYLICYVSGGAVIIVNIVLLIFYKTEKEDNINTVEPIEYEDSMIEEKKE